MPHVADASDPKRLFPAGRGWGITGIVPQAVVWFRALMSGAYDPQAAEGAPPFILDVEVLHGTGLRVKGHGIRR